MSDDTPPIAPSPTYMERRQSVIAGMSNARICLISAVILSILTLLAVLAVILAQTVTGQPLNTKVLYILISVNFTTIAGLLGGAGIGILNVLDGHQSALVRAIAEREHAIGVNEGLRENPHTNIS